MISWHEVGLFCFSFVLSHKFLLSFLIAFCRWSASTVEILLFHEHLYNFFYSFIFHSKGLWSLIIHRFIHEDIKLKELLLCILL